MRQLRAQSLAEGVPWQAWWRDKDGGTVTTLTSIGQIITNVWHAQSGSEVVTEALFQFAPLNLSLAFIAVFIIIGPFLDKQTLRAEIEYDPAVHAELFFQG